MTKLQKINGFILKIIAIVLMTIDHVGIFFKAFNGSETAPYMCGNIFRYVGRLAFPLFVLMLVEGIRHSKSNFKYLTRIGILMVTLTISEIIIFYFIDSSIEGAESPLVDLFMCGLVLALLHRKDKLSFLSLLPIGYILLATTIQVIEKANEISVVWFPFYIRPGYSLFALMLSLGFYYSHPIIDKIVLKNNLSLEDFQKTPQYRLMVNAMQCTFLVAINIFIYFMAYITYNNITMFDIYNASVETWSIFAALIILFYNGKRGYNKKWFQYGSYLYFPVHIVIIFVIFYVIYMGK